MKKLFLVGLAAAAMLTGCSNDDTVEIAPSKAIDFSNAFVNNATRASDPSLTKDNIQDFVVYGFAGDGKIFDGQEVTREGENWTYFPVQYWVPGHKYTFGAIAPKGEKGNVSDVKLEGEKVGMTVSFTNNGTTDLLHAAPIVVNCDANFVANPQPVALTFNHQLSKVKFTINGAMGGYEVIVSNVKIIDAYQTGTLTIAAGNTWGQQDNKTLVLNFGQGDEEKLMIPMDNTAEYTVKFHVELKKDGVSLSQYDHETTIKDVAFKAGYCYNFTANLTNENINPDQELKPIEFTVKEVKDWTEATSVPELPLKK